MTWPRITTGPDAPVDAHIYPLAAAQRLQEAAAALAPEERESLAPMYGGGGWWQRACARTGTERLTGNATRVVRGTPMDMGTGLPEHTDAAMFATAIRRQPEGVAEALHDECATAAARAHAGGQAAVAAALVALAAFIFAACHDREVTQ